MTPDYPSSLRLENLLNVSILEQKLSTAGVVVASGEDCILDQIRSYMVLCNVPVLHLKKVDTTPRSERLGVVQDELDHNKHPCVRVIMEYREFLCQVRMVLFHKEIILSPLLRLKLN